jgi:hypothetical protein
MDKLALFKLVEDYMRARGKDAWVVNTNTVPQGFVITYAHGEKEGIRLSLEELDKFRTAQIEAEKTAPEPVSSPV